MLIGPAIYASATPLGVITALATPAYVILSSATPLGTITTSIS